MAFDKKKYFYNFLRWGTALIFLYAGVVKIANPVLFAEQIDNYRLLPYLLVTIMAIFLPWLEVFCALLLILGKWTRGASLILMVLVAVFLVAIASAMARGLDITCGCFGATAESSKVGWQKLIEDVFLFAAIALVFYQQTFNSIVGSRD